MSDGYFTPVTTWADSCKQVAFAAGVQKKQKHCRALKGTMVQLSLTQIITQFEMFFLWNFCQAYMACRHQSLKYCNDNIHFL